MQIKNFNKINNQVFNIGGGKGNSIDLKNLTHLSQNLTNNKIEIKSIKNTDISDIPMYISNNKKVKRYYKWHPKKKIIDILTDVYKWQLKNLNILRKFMK